MSSSSKPRVARSTIINFFGSLISMVAGFVLLRELIEHLGMEQFGLYSMVSIFSVTGFIFLLEMGFQSSVVKYSAQYLAEQNWLKLERLTSSVTVIFFLIGFVVAAAGIVLSPWLTSFFEVQASLAPTLTRAFQITFATYVFSFPALMATAVLQGLQAFTVQKGVDTGFSLARALGSIALLFFGYGFFELVVFSAALQVLQCLVLFAYIILARRVRISPAKFSRVLLLEIREMTTLVFIGRLSSFAFTQTDRLVISHFLGSAALGIYESVIKLPFGVKSIGGQLNLVLMPASSYRSAGSEPQRALGSLFERGFDFQVLFTFPIIASLFIFARPTISLWLGPEASPSALLMRWAVFIPLLSTFLSAGGAILLGANLHLRRLTWLGFASAFINLILDVVLAPWLGLKGILAATILGTLCVLPPHIALFAKEFALSYWRMIRAPIVAFLCGAVLFGLNEFLGLDSRLTSWGLLIAASFVCSSLCGAMIYQFGLEKTQRAYLHQTLLKIKSKFA